MKCPTCPDATLVMTERTGVEIDYCPNCRGVWLDRGELDKILDRAAGNTAAPPEVAPPQQQHQQHQPPLYYGKKPDDSHYGYPSPHGGHRKKKSWLSEIFD